MKYAQNIDYLVSAILYLGTHSWYWARTPTNMAKELSLSPDKLRQVLESFPSVFRKSTKPSGNGEHFYSLQARYALREGEDTNEPDEVSYIKPLETGQVEMLLNFVVKMVEYEKSDTRARWSSWIAVGAAIVSAGAAIIVAVVS